MKTAPLTTETLTEQQAYQRLKGKGNLPTPSKKAFKIYKIANDDKSNIQDMASVILTDPAISASLVKLANSVFYKSLRPITSVDRAIVRLGLKMVKTISLGLSLLSQNQQGNCLAFDYERFWAESLIRAIVARDLATMKAENNSNHSTLDSDEGFTIGLFSQIGRLAFATAIPDEYSQLLRKIKPSEDNSLLVLEKKLFGLNHNELSACMMKDWHLPDAFCNAVRLQKAPDYMKKFSPGSTESDISDILDQEDWYLYMLKFTGTMSAIIMNPEIRLSKEVLDHALGEADHLGLSPADFPRKYDAINTEWEEISSILEIHSPPAPTWQKTYNQAKA